jgi:transposase
MDNTGPYKSKHTGNFLFYYSIKKLFWPAQSPDLNPIKKIWDYIQKQIRKRNTYPETKKEILKAWEEE